MPLFLPYTTCASTSELKKMRQGLPLTIARRAIPTLLAGFGLLGGGLSHAATITVNSNLDITPADDGVCTLREAINSANGDSASGPMAGECDAGAGADDIVFDASLTGQAIRLYGSQLPTITTEMTISGPTAGDASSIVLDGDGQSRVVDINGFDVPVSLNNLTITNGRTTADDLAGSGGGLRSFNAALTLSDCVISGNSTQGVNAEGGGMYSRTANVDTSVTNCVISNNRTEGEGASGGGVSHSGFICSQSASEINCSRDLLLANSRVTGNATESNNAEGGGVRVSFADLVTNGSIISGNTTRGMGASGGGISAEPSHLRLTDTIVSGNETQGANANGGGLISGSGIFNQITMLRSQVIDNSTSAADTDGGGLWVSLADFSFLRMTDSTVSGNAATRRGGGLYNQQTRLGSTITRSTFSGNTANDGGGIFDTSGYLSIVNSTLSGNSAAQGAGLCATAASDVTLNHVSVVNNSSSGAGITGSVAGGINQDGGNMVINNSLVVNNAGGDCSINGGTITGMTSIDSDTSCDTIAPTAFSTSNPFDIDNLAFNGGFTQTHSLIMGSAAIDGATAGLADDQRGISRPQGAGTDVGSTEFVATGVLGFSQLAFAERENNSPVTITVNRSDGTSGAASVQVTLADNTAVSPDDYTNPGVVTLNWADGEGGPKTFTVELVDDDLDENDPEFVDMTLMNPVGSVLSSQNTALLGILDPAPISPVVVAGEDDDDDDCSGADYLAFCIGAATPADLLLIIPLAFLGLWRRLMLNQKFRRMDT